MDVVDQVVHAVQAAEQGRLAAAGGPDEGRDLVPREVDGDVVQGLVAAVEEAQIRHLNDRVLPLGPGGSFGGGATATSILRASGTTGVGSSIVNLII